MAAAQLPAPGYAELLRAHLGGAVSSSADTPPLPVAPVILYGAAVDTAEEVVTSILRDLGLMTVSLSDVEVDGPLTFFRMIVGRVVSAASQDASLHHRSDLGRAAAVHLSMAVHVGGKRATTGATAGTAASASSAGVGAIQSMTDVALALRRLIPTHQALVVRISGADRLAAHLPDHMGTLLRLAALSDRAIVPLLMGEAATPITKCLAASDAPPLSLHVPPLDKEAAMAYLLTLAPEGSDMGLYKTAVGQLWGTFHALVGADIQELAYLVSVAWPLYQAQVMGGKVPSPAALFKAVGPALLPLKKRLFHRDAEVAAAPGAAGRGTDVELPHFAKYMLLAAFLASHNPADTDTAFFSRAKSGRRKGTKRRRSETSSSLDSGPQPFTLERLQAIFHALVASHTSAKASADAAGLDVLTTVASLVSLGLMARVGGRLGLDEVKLRCTAGRVTVQNVAERLQVDLGKFMAVKG